MGGGRGRCPLWESRKPCDLSHKHSVQSLVEGCVQLVSVTAVGAFWWEMLLHVLHVSHPPPTPGAMKCSTKWDRETTKSQVSLQIAAEGRIILAAGTQSIFAASGFPCPGSAVAPRDQEPLTSAKQGEEA